MAYDGSHVGASDTGQPERALPHSIEAEQAVLGSLLINNEVAEKLSGLEPSHFYDPVHGRVYKLAMGIIGKGRLASPVTLKPYLMVDRGLIELGGLDYVARLAGAAISLLAAGEYATMLRELAARRDMIRVADELQSSAAENFEGTVDDLFAEAERAMSELRDATGDELPGVSIAEAMETALTGINDAYKNDTPPGISLGIPALEGVIGKPLPGDYVLIGARPSMGKSAVAAEIARRCAKAGIAVVYWCHEMAPEQNAERILSAESRAEKKQNIAYRDARDGRLTEDEYRTLIESARDMEKMPLHFVESSIRDLPRLIYEFRRHVRRFQRRGLEVIVIVDYLQKITTRAGARPIDRVSEASSELKALLIQLRVPGLILSQLSRGVENREDKRPHLSDLRESGEIEQDANTAIFLYRDEYYLMRDLDGEMPDADRADIEAVLARKRGLMEMIVSKQRSGPTKTAMVGFDGATNSLYPWGEVVPFDRSAPSDHPEFGI